MSDNSRQLFEWTISLQTMIKIVLFAFVVWIVTESLSIILMVYISVILASALKPIVKWGNYFKIPKSISILIIYMGIIAGISSLVSMILPSIVQEMTNLIRSLPILFDQLGTRYSWMEGYIENPQFQELIRSMSTNMQSWLTSQSTGVLTNAWSLTSSVFGGLIGIFLVLTMTFYLMVGENQLIKSILSVAPSGQKHHIPALILAIQSKLGAWFRGEISLMLIVGTLSYIGFSLIGTQYALPLAVIAGLMEIVPYIGPNLTAVITFVLLLPTSLLMALLGVLVVLIVQQLENTMIVPQVMKQAVGLDPLFVIISLAVGSQIFGIAGAILAVPMVATVQIIIQFYQQYEKEQLSFRERMKSIAEEDSPPDNPAETIGNLLQRLRARINV